MTRQPFEYNFFEELAAPTVAGTSPGFPFTYTEGPNISTMDYSGSGTVSGVVQGVNDNIVPLPVGQPDSTSNAGCEDADFTGFTGDIALIQRGTCFFSDKIANAVEAGAEAVIIFNEGNSDGAFRPRLRPGELPARRPCDRDERRSGRGAGEVHRGGGRCRSDR